MRCAGEIARVRTGPVGDAARDDGVGDREGAVGLGESKEGRRADGVVGVSGRCDVDAEGPTRCVGVRDEDRASGGLRARGVVGSGELLKGK